MKNPTSSFYAGLCKAPTPQKTLSQIRPLNTKKHDITTQPFLGLLNHRSVPVSYKKITLTTITNRCLKTLSPNNKKKPGGGG
ncbi:hypothetical protein ACVGW6_16170, partial [Enterobacter intestinihominis]